MTTVIADDQNKIKVSSGVQVRLWTASLVEDLCSKTPTSLAWNVVSISALIEKWCVHEPGGEGWYDESKEMERNLYQPRFRWNVTHIREP